MDGRAAAVSLALASACAGVSPPPGEFGSPPSSERRSTGSCPAPDHLAVTARYIQVLATNASLVAGHGSRVEAVGTLALPAWNVAPANYAFLLAPCDGPFLYDPWCDGDTCWQLECVEPGASWKQHADLFPLPRTRNQWRYEAGFTDVKWTDGGTDLQLALGGDVFDPAGQDYSFRGAERVLVDRIEIALRFPGLLGTGEVLRALARVDLATGAPTGILQIDGDEVGRLVDGPAGFEWVGSGACL